MAKIEWIYCPWVRDPDNLILSFIFSQKDQSFGQSQSFVFWSFMHFLRRGVSGVWWCLPNYQLSPPPNKAVFHAIALGWKILCSRNPRSGWCLMWIYPPVSCLFRNWLNELENERGTFFVKKAGSILGFHLKDSILRNAFMEGNIENVWPHQNLLMIQSLILYL